jgi:hypothetical protein
MLVWYCIPFSRGLCLWNPGMGTKYEYFVIFFDYPLSMRHSFKYYFGYDNSTCTYKVVVFYTDVEHDGCDEKTMAKVFSLGMILGEIYVVSLVLPHQWCRDKNNGVYLNSTISWFVLHDHCCSNYGSCSKYSSFTVDR